MELAPYYLAKLREGLEVKQKSNPQYSLRAYARDIGLNPGTLSQIIKGTRTLPLKDSVLVARKLKLNTLEQSLFMESLRASQLKDSPEFTLQMQDESYYKIIAEWEHYAVLELFDLADFGRTPREVSVKLGLNLQRTEEVLNNLLGTGLIKFDEEGYLQRTHANVKTTEDIASRAIRDSHKETLRLGEVKLDEIAIELRDFSSSTLALDPEKLPEAKALIREFRKKMAALVKDGNKSHIYQLAIQFYPLSKIEKTRH